MARKLCFFILILSLSFGCQQPPAADEILLKAMQAHGGIAAWESAKEITYRKKTVLYDSLGNIESEKIQLHRNGFSPEFYAAMQWTEDSVERKVTLSKGEIISPETDADLKRAYYDQILQAQYVFWQPYKLLEPGTSMTYQGLEQFGDDSQAHVLEVTYPEQPDSNTWWYFFDAISYKLIATMVEHGSTYSLIVNTSYENQTGLSLNASRQSYRVDRDRNIKFLRASYTYEIIEWKN